jgi:hypothetical protein
MPDEPAAQPPGARVFKTPEEALASLAPLRERINKVTDRTPSVVLNALLPPRTIVVDIHLPRIKGKTWLRLERIRSPFVTGELEHVTMADLFRTFYIIAVAPEEVGQALEAGEAAFNRAVEEFADLVDLSDFAAVSQILAEHIGSHFAPKAELTRQEEASGTGPKAVASSATASGPS